MSPTFGCGYRTPGKAGAAGVAPLAPSRRAPLSSTRETLHLSHRWGAREGLWHQHRILKTPASPGGDGRPCGRHGGAMRAELAWRNPPASSPLHRYLLTGVYRPHAASSTPAQVVHSSPLSSAPMCADTSRSQPAAKRLVLETSFSRDLSGMSVIGARRPHARAPPDEAGYSSSHHAKRTPLHLGLGLGEGREVRLLEEEV